MNIRKHLPAGAVWLALLAFPALTLHAQPHPAPPDPVQQHMDALEHSVSLLKYVIRGAPAPTLEARMAYYGVPGLSIAVIHEGRVEWAKGYGWANAEAKIPVTPETLFQPGSISKSLNAMTVLSLVDAGKLSLKGDINRQLRSWQFPYDTTTHGKVITLRHLLSHTAGLGVHGFPGYSYGQALPTLPQILDGIPPANSEPVRSLFEPGLRYQYSGGGTLITQLMAMDASGLPYDELVRRQVFEPLGMHSSYFTQPAPAALHPRMATGYTGAGEALPDGHTLVLEQAAGGLWTTPTDICRFILEMQQSRLGKSNRVLRKKTTQRMLTPVMAENVGLGVFIENHGGSLYFQHAAANPGFCGKYYGSFEGGSGIVICMNADYGTPLIDEIMRAVTRTYAWEGWQVDTLVPMDTVRLPVADLPRYAGFYRDGAVVTHIVADGDHLSFQATDQVWTAHFTDTASFFNLESKTTKHFHFDSLGRATGYTRKLDGKVLTEAVRQPDITLTGAEVQAYSGIYDDGEGGTLEILESGGHLFLKSTVGTHQMHFLSRTEFVILEHFAFRFTLSVDAAAQVRGILFRVEDGPEFLMKRLK